MAKPIGEALAYGTASAPLREHLATVRSAQPPATAWSSVEPGFIAALAAFDDAVSEGQATEGERQNGKGDYFNDLVAVLLENCSGTGLSKRMAVPGLIFPKHNLDVTYPPSGSIIEVLVEAKMMGTPKHPGSPKAKPMGRPGSADMLKRCKESGFKTIDLKGGYGFKQQEAGVAKQAGISGDLTTWLHSVKPRSYMVFGVRVVSASDLSAVVEMAQNMTQVVDGVGIAAYRPIGYKPANAQPARYERVHVPNSVDLGMVLHRICNDLAAAAQAVAQPTPERLKLDSVSAPAAHLGDLDGDLDDDDDDTSD